MKNENAKKKKNFQILSVSHGNKIGVQVEFSETRGQGILLLFFFLSCLKKIYSNFCKKSKKKRRNLLFQFYHSCFELEW